MFLLLLLLVLLQTAKTCQQNCASCRQLASNDTSCLACSEGFSPVEGGGCEPESTLPNCARYDSSLNCLACRPTFEPIWNSCQRTFAGCLIFRGSCLQCLPGAVLNPAGTCAIQYLNCIAVSPQGVCTACQPRYILRNGKCNYQSSSCAFVDKNTGLCTQCSSSNVLLGTSCVPTAWIANNRNCYLAEEATSNLTCRYCKQGFGLYLGSCLPFSRIVNLTTLSANCSALEYLESNQPQCANASANWPNCLLMDFGRLACTFCAAGFDLINGTCQSIADNFCLNGSARSCRTCKQGFFLRSGQCAPFPPYCVAFTTVCTACQPNFQLVGSQCFDPNCQTANPITRACQICLANYRVNPFGVCKFIDPNCMRFNESLDCSSCAKGYSMRAGLQYCVYQDLNCLSFDNSTGGCSMCRPFYAYNDQVQLCVPLPDDCQAADRSGRCSSCMSGYNLISNYTCLFIPALPNCQMISKDDYNRCVLCTNGSYADPNGACRPLPTFCAAYDSANNQCLQCRDNGLMRSGSCVDKNCQIFDQDGGCLACIASYQFSSFGQCVFSPRDPNCKEFVFGICKSCVQRYYFDSSFVCVAASPLCKTYDANSGACLSCYDGYQLSANGGCFINIFQSIVGNNDILSSSCKRYNNNGQCVQCYFGYQAIAVANQTEVVECVLSSQQSRNSYCLSQDASGKCVECVYRMFVNASGMCAGIDENCNEYNQSTGACISCYPGYSNTPNNKSSRCSIIVDSDPNCQTRGNSSICLKCYAGFYFSLESLKCLQVNQLCATFNSTTGDCLTCYDGYALAQGNCKIANTSTQNTAINPSAAVGCLQTSAGRCTTCDWGFALINGSCVQRDLNCQVFAGPNSLSCNICYNGYKPFGANQTRCVLATLLIDHCLKYSASVECVLCENGFILSRNAQASPAYTCNLIDQNCLIFNPTANACSQCLEGAVLQGSACIVPTYGVDSNCAFYVNRLCSTCRKGFSLSGYLCSAN